MGRAGAAFAWIGGASPCGPPHSCRGRLVPIPEVASVHANRGGAGLRVTWQPEHCERACGAPLAMSLNRCRAKPAGLYANGRPSIRAALSWYTFLRISSGRPMP